MKKRSMRSVPRVAIAATALALGTAMAIGSTAQAASGGNPNANIVYHVGPQTKVFAQGIKPSALPTPSQCLATYGLICYTPQEIRKAYNVPSTLTGVGTSIAIIDAYGSPTAQSDLDTFSTAMGIPSTTVHIYCPDGCPKTTTAHKGGPLGWAGETSLDVQWAHAIAPGARINLVVASTNYGNSLNNAVRYAVAHDLGDVLTMSYGANEAGINAGANNSQLIQSHKNFQAAIAKNISLFASSGDSGATGGGTTPTASYPSSDPLVTAVGGTNLYTADDSGTYGSETVWGDFFDCPFTCKYGPIGATGGAPSVLFPAPAYQVGVTGFSTRTTSDVSYDASVYTSVLVYEGFNPNPDDNGFYFTGGTSSGSPQWAAIGALADQAAGHRLGQLNPKLYALAGNATTYAADFHDVTMGNNEDSIGGFGYDAKVGYDLPTGLGSPNVANLITDLAK